ncbi:PfkB family carbohydrate kinase, partial [Escherichia coli]|nr:PfkB family carbohydrate kinase [Escherichia coli]
AVSSHLKTVLADCDLIVGTEEEVLIASGEADLLAALKTIRALSAHATIVLKRGPMGCIVYEGAISDNLEDGIVGKGFPIEVFNVLGAGDAFMSGF